MNDFSRLRPLTPLLQLRWLALILFGKVRTKREAIFTPASPLRPIFQAGNGKPLNLDNLVRRVIVSALSRCAVCNKAESEHKPEAHLFQRDDSLPRWHGWHAFRRGLATNLHELGVDDKTIQGILRHSNIAVTQNIYIKSVSESQVSAMDTLAEKFGTATEFAPSLHRPSERKPN